MSDRHPRGYARRRVLAILAGGAAAWRCGPVSANPVLTRWRGHALGGETALTIRDPDRARAEAAIAACVAAIRRLEAIFSLYRPDSALVRLNRAGHLAAPPAGLVTVLETAARISALSDGTFDVTVQPLWPAFVRAQRDPAGAGEALERARALVGWRGLAVGRDRLAFAHPGMAATLNGIAQGYATDRIAGLLRAHGFAHVLVNLGEFRGCGDKGGGQPWRVGVGWPDGEGVAATLALGDRAVATSSPLATTFDPAGTAHHLFNPATGRSAQSWASVSVVARTALLADALSTAIAVAPEEAAPSLLARGGGEAAILIDRRGRLVRLQA